MHKIPTELASSFIVPCKERIQSTILTVSKARWNRDAIKGSTNEGSTYAKIEVAAATVSARDSFLLY